MEIQELRIGNLVNHEQTTHVIKSIGGSRVSSVWLKGEDGDVYNKSIKHIKPIPLTAEWLVRFGFGKGEFDTEFIDNVSMKGLVFSYHVGVGILLLETSSDVIKIPHIKHVHSLQNLYFALTGKELELIDPSDIHVKNKEK